MIFLQKVFYATLLAAVGLATNASAAVIVNFNDDGSADADDPLPSVETIVGVSTTPLTQEGFTSTFRNASSWPVGRWADSFDATRYVTFTVTPDAGSSIEFDTIVWDKGLFGGSGGAVASAQLRTSVDGFASNLVSPTGGFANDRGLLTYDVSGLGTLSTPVEFRFHFIGDGTGSGAFSDLATGDGDTGLILNGSVVAAIPEPGSLAGLSLLATGLLARRRRK